MTKLTDRELISSVITVVMSGKQSERDAACAKLQRHIVTVEAQLATAQERITELEQLVNIGSMVAGELRQALSDRQSEHDLRVKLAGDLEATQARLREAERLLSNPDLMQLMHYAAEAHGLELWDADRRTWLAGGAKEGA